MDPSMKNTVIPPPFPHYRKKQVVFYFYETQSSKRLDIAGSKHPTSSML